MHIPRVVGAVALVLCAGAAGAARHPARPPAPQPQPGLRRIDLQRRDLDVPGREVVQARVELDPGVASGRHWHPGEEIIYVLEGSLEYEVEGGRTVTLGPGGVLFIPARAVHAARNVGRGTGAELATYVVEKGKPLVTPVR